MRITRRRVLGTLAAGAAASLPLGGTGCQSVSASADGCCSPEGAKCACDCGCPTCGAPKKIAAPKNADFYKPDGTFDPQKAKAAFYALMEHHRYPIVPRLRGDDFWVADFGIGNFAEVGMGGIFWLNEEAGDYFGHEIYLLPGQIIPEHRHLKTEHARAKREGWQVRYGKVWIYGEGDPTPGVEARIPPSHRAVAKARHEQELLPGEVGNLAGAEQWHWMRAGPEGAIVTEYASYHDNAGLRFTLESIKF